MKITGEHIFAAPREEVWQALLDPEVLAHTLPGCEDLKQSAENTFEGRLTMKVGPVQGVFQGKVTLSDLDPPRAYSLNLNGKGAPGFVNGKGSLELEEQDGKTLMHYEVDAQVGGRIAGVGQRLLDSSAKVITRQALEGLERQIEQRRAASGGGGASESGGATAESATTSPQPPSQTRFLAAFIGGLLGELIPKERRAMVIVVAAGLALVITALVLRSCAGT